MDCCLFSSVPFVMFTKFYEEIIMHIIIMHKCIGRVCICIQTHMFIFYISFSQSKGNINFA